MESRCAAVAEPGTGFSGSSASIISLLVAGQFFLKQLVVTELCTYLWMSYSLWLTWTVFNLCMWLHQNSQRKKQQEAIEAFYLSKYNQLQHEQTAKRGQRQITYYFHGYEFPFACCSSFNLHLLTCHQIKIYGYQAAVKSSYFQPQLITVFDYFYEIDFPEYCSLNHHKTVCWFLFRWSFTCLSSWFAKRVILAASRLLIYKLTVDILKYFQLISAVPYVRVGSVFSVITWTLCRSTAGFHQIFICMPCSWNNGCPLKPALLGQSWRG